MRKLVIFGTRQIAEVCAFYFEHDSAYQVVAFTVDGAFVDAAQFRGRPIVAWEDLATEFPPDEHDMFVAVGYGKMNRIRALVASIDAPRVANSLSRKWRTSRRT